MSKTVSSSKKRKTRSDKFPLTLHPTGQYCKKIKGKLYYFGTNKGEALQRYLEDALFLHSGKGQRRNVTNGNVSIKKAFHVNISCGNIHLPRPMSKFIRIYYHPGIKAITLYKINSYISTKKSFTNIPDNNAQLQKLHAILRRRILE